MVFPISNCELNYTLASIAGIMTSQPKMKITLSHNVSMRKSISIQLYQEGKLKELRKEGTINGIVGHHKNQSDDVSRQMAEFTDRVVDIPKKIAPGANREGQTEKERKVQLERKPGQVTYKVYQ